MPGTKLPTTIVLSQMDQSGPARGVALVSAYLAREPNWSLHLSEPLLSLMIEVIVGCVWLELSLAYRATGGWRGASVGVEPKNEGRFSQ